MKKSKEINAGAEPKESFESSLKQLEELVENLESGEKGLEESLALFEKGVSLAKELTERLEEAKQKIEVLTRENGKPAKKPIEKGD